ncbi:MAG: DUF4129 domain-containing protein [Candidatus Bathyarchaeota archaeon]|nr:DUF4129 domain-containing protein [Candidatus Bathyarchaeota archaeon]
MSHVVLGDVPRHVDPAGLSLENPDAEMLYSLIGQVYDLALLGDFNFSKTIIDQLYSVTGSSELDSLLLEYAGELEVHVNTNEELEQRMNKILETVQSPMIQEVFEYLKAIGRPLSGAHITLGKLGSHTEQLGEMLASEPVELFEDLSLYAVYLENLETMIEDLELFLEEGVISDTLREYAEEVIGLAIGDIPDISEMQVPSLEFWLNVSEAQDGSSVLVEGVLATGSGGLADKKVRLIFDDRVVSEVTTGSDGGFVEHVVVPGIYEPWVEVHVEYFPADEDLFKYLPAISGRYNLTLLFYTPVIIVSELQPVFPGKTFSVEGTLSHDGVALQGHGVRGVLLGGKSLATTDFDGKFQLEFIVDGEVEEQMTELLVRTIPSGPYGPASLKVPVEVTRLPVDLGLHFGDWVLSGASVHVSGQVSSSSLPLADAVVIVSGELGVSTVSTDEYGMFSASLGTQLTIPTSTQGFVVSVYPVEPWVASRSVVCQVRVVNLLSFLTVPVVVGSVTFLYRRRRGEEERDEPKPLELVIPEPMEASVESMVVSDYYRVAVELVARVTGIGLAPSHTVREYVVMVRGGLGEALSGVFSELSDVYERWLYGRPENRLGDMVKKLYRRFLGASSDES